MKNSQTNQPFAKLDDENFLEELSLNLVGFQLPQNRTFISLTLFKVKFEYILRSFVAGIISFFFESLTTLTLGLWEEDVQKLVDRINLRLLSWQESNQREVVNLAFCDFCQSLAAIYYRYSNDQLSTQQFNRIVGLGGWGKISKRINLINLAYQFKQYDRAFSELVLLSHQVLED